MILRISCHRAALPSDIVQQFGQQGFPQHGGQLNPGEALHKTVREHSDVEVQSDVPDHRR